MRSKILFGALILIFIFSFRLCRRGEVINHFNASEIKSIEIVSNYGIQNDYKTINIIDDAGKLIIASELNKLQRIKPVGVKATVGEYELVIKTNTNQTSFFIVYTIYDGVVIMGRDETGGYGSFYRNNNLEKIVSSQFQTK